MKVLTFNIWNFPGSAHRRARMAAIAATLRGGDWDAVLLQELWPVGERRQFDGPPLDGAADMEHPWTRPANWLAAPFAVFGRGWIVDTGLRILTRTPIRDTRHIYYPGSPSNRGLFRRGALAVKIEAGGLGPVWLVNTHLVHATRHGQRNPERLAQITALRTWIDETLTDAPVVLGGDLNAGPAIHGSHAAGEDPEFWHRILAGPLAGFSPGTGDLTGATWSAQANPYVAADPDREEARLDHLLAGPGLAAHDVTVRFRHAAALPDGSTGPLSDHFGVEARIAEG